MNSKHFSLIISIIAAFVLLIEVSHAEVSQASERVQEQCSRIVICTQNLFNYGLPSGDQTFNWKNKKPARKSIKLTRDDKRKRRTQRRALINRFVNASCDVIAVQEVVGTNKDNARKNLETLANALTSRTKRKFIVQVADTNDRRIRNGYIVATDRGEIINVQNFAGRELEPLSPYGPLRRFSRGPFLLKYKLSEGNSSRELWLLTIHFKSKQGAFRDPTHTDYEVDRMEMAETVRTIVEQIAHPQVATRPSHKSPIIVVLGDRNSDEFSAGSQVLSGQLLLDDFKKGGACKLAKNFTPSCAVPVNRRPLLTGIFAKAKKEIPKFSSVGSYKYRGKINLIDEIHLLETDLSLVFRAGNNDLGTEGDFFDGSDHKLLWAGLCL